MGDDRRRVIIVSPDSPVVDHLMAMQKHLDIHVLIADVTKLREEIVFPVQALGMNFESMFIEPYGSAAPSPSTALVAASRAGLRAVVEKL